MFIKTILQEKKAIFSYLIIGAVTAAIYLSAFALFWQVLGLNYKLSVTITYVVAILFHFTANRRFTFKAQGAQLLQQVVRYLCMIAGNYFVTLSIVYVVVEILHLSPYVGLVVAIVTNVNLNFITSRFWVFKAGL